MPSAAHHTSRLLPLVRSLTRIDHGKRGAMRHKQHCVLVRRNAQISDAIRVRRPHRALVLIGRRIQVRNRLRRHRVDRDKAVIAAIAHERQPRAVRRPSQVLRRPPRLHQLFRLRGPRERVLVRRVRPRVRLTQLQRPYLALHNIRHQLSVGRNRRARSLPPACAVLRLPRVPSRSAAVRPS